MVGSYPPPMKDGNQFGGQATQSPESLKEVETIQNIGNMIMAAQHISAAWRNQKKRL